MGSAKKRRREAAAIATAKHSETDDQSKQKKKPKLVNEAIEETTAQPKSKKELRKERKLRLKKEIEKQDATRNKNDADDSNTNKKLSKAEKLRLQKDQRREEQRLERKAKKEAREEAEQERFREQDRLRQEKEQLKQKITSNSSKRNSKCKNPKGEDVENDDNVSDYSVYKSIFKKTKDSTTGMTTCRMGVQYKDVKVGTGPVARPNSLLTVKYQLHGKTSNGILLDSSKKFVVRLGKGEVIAGWDIGVEGMRVGGTRHIVVPPKAGYGGDDIGAGPGAILHFHITLLNLQ